MSQTAKRAVVSGPVKKKTNPVVYLLIVLIFIAILAVLYYMAARYYTGRFPNHTSINHVDVSNMTAENAKTALNEQTQNYVLTITERGGGSETIAARQISMSYDDNGDVDELLAQYNPWLWILSYFNTEELSATESTVYDEDLLQDEVDNLNCFSAAYVTKVENASLERDGDSFYIKEEVQGNELDKEKTLSAIQDALSINAASVDLEEANCYLAPTVYSDDEKLTTELDKLETWLSAEITYDFEDNRIEVADRSVIIEWLTENDDGTYDLDEEAAFEWVKTQLAYQYDTFGLTHEFTTSKGGTVTLKGGDYGWCIARQDTTDALVAAVKEGAVNTLEPSYQYSAKNRGVNDIGGTYVEISISAQHVWCYKDYELVVDTDCVTGNPNKGNGTPSGSVWAIDAKKSPATLGTMDTMGYESDVTYWMPFNGNIGLHDADGWRTKYGGNIYLTNGSHGCVNLPYSAAQAIYNAVEIGTAVVVY